MRRGGGGAWSLAWRRTREQLSQPLSQAEDGRRPSPVSLFRRLWRRGRGSSWIRKLGSRGKKGGSEGASSEVTTYKGRERAQRVWRIASESPSVSCAAWSPSPPSILPTVYKPHRGGKGAGSGRELFVVVVEEGKSRTIPFPFPLPSQFSVACLLAWERPIGSLFLLPSSSFSSAVL